MLRLRGRAAKIAVSMLVLDPFPAPRVGIWFGCYRLCRRIFSGPGRQVCLGEIGYGTDIAVVEVNVTVTCAPSAPLRDASQR